MAKMVLNEYQGSDILPQEESETEKKERVASQTIKETIQEAIQV